MKEIQDILDELPNLKPSMAMACDWLVDIAQVQTEQLTIECNELGLNHKKWKGAIRGEYNVGTKTWGFFAPVWHTGQAITALLQANEVAGNEKYVQAAVAGADFIVGNQLTSEPDAGLIYAHELLPENIFVSAILECLDGLLMAGRVAGQHRYTDAAINAARWCRDRAWIPGEGLVHDLYDPRTGRFIDDYVVTKDNAPGRPLADDAIFLKMFQLTREEKFRSAFYEIMHRLLRDENPRGNWVDYGPCRPDKGECHPRHAYWWGSPMIDAWQDSGDERYLDMARRCGDWYIKAQRNDGGLFRYTDLNFRTDSFGHATSGIACAVILWTRLFRETGETKWLEPIRKAVAYCIGMQFTNPADSNLRGCILEKVNPPDGTDRSPYYIRDLGTIFFVQACALLLKPKKSVTVQTKPAVKAAVQRTTGKHLAGTSVS